MRILWLGKRFYTNKDALREHFGRIYQLPKYWKQTGESVRLWLVDYHTHEIGYENDAGFEIISAPLISFQTIREIFRTLTTKRVEFIIGSGDCYIGYLGWLLSRISGAAFIFDIYDKYDEFSGYRRFVGFDLFRFLLKHANGVIFASRALANKLQTNTSRAFHITPNGINPELFKPRDMVECRLELGLPDKIILVGYFGSMEPDRGVADLVEAVALLRKAGKPIELLLAGKMKLPLHFNMPWVHYLGSVPHSQIPLLINACNILAIPYRIGSLIDMVSSCKIAEFLACKRPLIATRTPSFLENFSAQATALGQALCNASDPNDMARALAYQIRVSIIPPFVEDMTWQTIADNTLAWLAKSNENVG